MLGDDDLATVQKAFREGGIGQTWGFLHAKLCGHTKSLEFQASNPKLVREGRYLRCDLQLPEPLPRLDDAASIAGMKVLAEQSFGNFVEPASFRPIGREYDVLF
jgi:hypothetical protein